MTTATHEVQPGENDCIAYIDGKRILANNQTLLLGNVAARWPAWLAFSTGSYETYAAAAIFCDTEEEARRIAAEHAVEFDAIAKVNEEFGRDHQRIFWPDHESYMMGRFVAWFGALLYGSNELGLVLQFGPVLVRQNKYDEDCDAMLNVLPVSPVEHADRLALVEGDRATLHSILETDPEKKHGLLVGDLILGTAEDDGKPLPLHLVWGDQVDRLRDQIEAAGLIVRAEWQSEESKWGVGSDEEE